MILKGEQIERTVYNQKANAFILLTRDNDSNLDLSRIYFKIASKEYKSIDIKSKQKYSYESLISSNTTENIYYFIAERRRVDNIAVSIECLDVCQYNLLTGVNRSLFKPNELKLENSENRVWVVDLLSVSEDGMNVYCNVGLQSSKIEYYVVSINVVTKTIDKLIKLEECFY